MVIPAYNEEAWLPRLLDSAGIARERYRGGADAIEIIVADNDSTDATAHIARAHGFKVVTVEKRAIAAARNGGAKLARGEFLCFIDADSRIHPETFNAIDAALAAGRFVAGATGIHPERWSVGIAATWLLALPLGNLWTSPRGRALSWRDGMLGVVVKPRVAPLASGSFANCATQTARQDSARRVGMRNGSSSAPGLPNECLASYIKYDLRSLTPNLSHFRAHLANPAIPDDLFIGSLGIMNSQGLLDKRD